MALCKAVIVFAETSRNSRSFTTMTGDRADSNYASLRQFQSTSTEETWCQSARLTDANKLRRPGLRKNQADPESFDDFRDGYPLQGASQWPRNYFSQIRKVSPAIRLYADVRSGVWLFTWHGCRGFLFLAKQHLGRISACKWRSEPRHPSSSYTCSAGTVAETHFWDNSELPKPSEFERFQTA